MEFLISKVFWGIVASIISFVALMPYMVGTFKGTIKPHVFSWFIWGVSTLTVFAAQWVDDGGAGSWSTAVGGSMTFVIIALAVYRSHRDAALHQDQKADLSITRADWAVLFTCLSALPLWFFTDNPLFAVCLLTMIDMLAYIPTFRKSWHKPYEEQLFMFVVMTIRNIIAASSLEHYSMTTLMFPVVTACANIALISFIMVRRKQIEH